MSTFILNNPYPITSVGSVSADLDDYVLKTSLDDYVLKAGDTMSGNLRVNTKIGINCAPQAKLHVNGDGDQNILLQNAAIGFADAALTYGDLTLGRWEPYFLDLANWGDAAENAEATVFRVSSNSTLGKEATLALVRGDSPNIEFLDLFNNGYVDSYEYGIRIQKRGTGEYRDFVIQHSDGVAAVEDIINVQADGNILITPTTNTIFTGNVVIGNVAPTSVFQVVGLAEHADNAAALLAGLTSGAFYRTGDLLKVCH